MSHSSILSLEVPEAVECGHELFSQMIDEEYARRDSIRRPTGIEEIQESLMAENPDEYVIPVDTYKKYKLLAALAGAGYMSEDLAPEDLTDRIDSNQSCFRCDLQDVEQSKKPLEPFSYGVYVMKKESYIEAFAYNFNFIGKLSLYESLEGGQ